MLKLGNVGTKNINVATLNISKLKTVELKNVLNAFPGWFVIYLSPK
ncbi:hypothetical protein V2P57_04015 [Mycoplasma mycoides subsp. mycoides]|nr:hypothetical protein [Mycoplasma mycoides]QKK61030.1 hypothetical protein HR079_01840 [Mycoplasma mycoides]QKK61457.1 hypothetical protein HR079_04515 [Mycoplasma mycoides]QQY78061.1 hypothetical protein JLS56_03875 [Mycoplasma mycoides subsp. capri]